MKHTCKIFIYAIVFLFVTMATHVFANEKNISAVSEQKLYPSASYLTLEDKNLVELEKNGDYSESSYTKLKILTEDARKMFSSMNFSYNTKYNPITKLDIRIVLPDGSVKTIPDSDIIDSTHPSLQAMNIYEPTSRMKMVNIGDVPIGTIIEIEKVELGKQIIKNGYINNFLFQSTEPVIFSELKIKVPDGMSVNYYTSGKEKFFFSEKKIKDATEFTWSVKNMPAIIPEPSMPDLGSVLQGIYLTTFKTWEDASRYYYNLNKDKYMANDAIKAKVKELTAGLKTEEQKVLAIHRFIARNIRYMGSSMDSNAFIEAHDAGYTFEKAYGICRDKAVLMTTMLRLIGIDCYDMLINPSSETDPRVPTLFFEHAVCVVKLNGSMIVMDPTDEMSRELGSYYAGERYALPILEGGADIYKIPAIPPEKNLGKVLYSSTLTDDFKLSTDVKMSGVGMYEVILRGFKGSYSDDIFALLLGRYASTLSPSANASDILTGTPEDLDTPFGISFKVTADDYGVQAGKYRLISFPGLKSPFDVYLLNSLSSASSLKTRNYDISFMAPCAYETEDTILIPKGYKVISLPEDLSLSNGFISANLKFRSSGNKVIFTGKYSINKRIIPAKHYESFKSIAETIEKSSKRLIIIEKI